MAMRAQEPAEAEPEQMERPASAWGGGMPDSLELLWGMLSLRREENGEEHICLFWGLLDIRTRRRTRRRVGDAYQEAISNADQRLEALRAAAIFGSLGVGFAFLASLSDRNFWSGIWTVSSVLLLALTGGQVISIYADRLRQRFLNEEVDRAREQTAVRRSLAGQHARDIQALTASIAHEIRNPITAAKSLVQQMGEDPGAADNVEYASVALQELDRVERSVSHLLRFARDEDVTTVEMRLSDVIDSALGTLESQTQEAGLTIHRELDVPGSMSGDPEKLRRVILNLVRNSIEALDEAGTPDPRVEVHMGENLGGTQLWVRVRDNGPGIPAEERSRVFQPFHTTKEDGTGLGLAISRKVVEAHDGTIEVGAAPGGGTEFLISLPREAGKPAAS